jgi:uncharacterized damage-inducible protein DinB
MAGMSDQVAELFLEISGRKFGTSTKSVADCLGRLTDEQVWAKGGAHENSIGNLILHLCGNMRQWMLHGVRGDADVRERDLEFETAGGMSRGELARLEGVVGEVRGVVASLPHARLLERIDPQHGEVSVLEAIYHVVEHYRLHVGQIILLTKQMVGDDLDLSMPRRR